MNFNGSDEESSDSLSLISRFRGLQTSIQANPDYLSFKAGVIEIADGQAHPRPERGRVQIEIHRNQITIQFMHRGSNEIIWTMRVDPHQMYAEYLPPPQHPRVITLRLNKSYSKPPTRPIIDTTPLNAASSTVLNVPNGAIILEQFRQFQQLQQQQKQSKALQKRHQQYSQQQFNPKHLPNQQHPFLSHDFYDYPDDDEEMSHKDDLAAFLNTSSLFTPSSQHPSIPIPSLSDLQNLLKSTQLQPLASLNTSEPIILPQINYSNESLVPASSKYFWLQEIEGSIDDKQLCVKLNQILRPGTNSSQPPPSPKIQPRHASVSVSVSSKRSTNYGEGGTKSKEDLEHENQFVSLASGGILTGISPHELQDDTRKHTSTSINDKSTNPASTTQTSSHLPPTDQSQDPFSDAAKGPQKRKQQASAPTTTATTTSASQPRLNVDTAPTTTTTTTTTTSADQHVDEYDINDEQNEESSKKSTSDNPPSTTTTTTTTTTTKPTPTNPSQSQSQSQPTPQIVKLTARKKQRTSIDPLNNPISHVTSSTSAKLASVLASASTNATNPLSIAPSSSKLPSLRSFTNNIPLNINAGSLGQISVNVPLQLPKITVQSTPIASPPSISSPTATTSSTSTPVPPISSTVPTSAIKSPTKLTTASTSTAPAKTEDGLNEFVSLLAPQATHEQLQQLQQFQEEDELNTKKLKAITNTTQSQPPHQQQQQQLSQSQHQSSQSPSHQNSQEEQTTTTTTTSTPSKSISICDHGLSKPQKRGRRDDD